MNIHDTVNIAELRQLAEENLSPMAWDYYRSGANDELTLADNRAAWDRIRVAYRVMVDVSQRDMTTSVLGHDLDIPIVIAPTAFHRLACDEGELATVRAAETVGSMMIVSSLSTTAIEDIAAATNRPFFFQLYVYQDRGVTKELVERVVAAGAKALFVTVDAPYLGRRERDVRNQFALPPGVHVENLLPAGMGDLVKADHESGLAAYFESLLDRALTWDDISWLRSITTIPIVLKGVVRADDAARAMELGAAGVVVSNHGGRQLDTSIATADALGPVVKAVDGRGVVLVDGGIRRGVHVLKAIALGADAVLLGRPILWGLAAGGQQGAERVLDLLRAELDLAMALAGTPTLDAVTADLLV